MVVMVTGSWLGVQSSSFSAPVFQFPSGETPIKKRNITTMAKKTGFPDRVVNKLALKNSFKNKFVKFYAKICF
jgi:hypothetical protein